MATPPENDDDTYVPAQQKPALFLTAVKQQSRIAIASRACRTRGNCPLHAPTTVILLPKPAQSHPYNLRTRPPPPSLLTLTTPSSTYME